MPATTTTTANDILIDDVNNTKHISKVVAHVVPFSRCERIVDDCCDALIYNLLMATSVHTHTHTIRTAKTFDSIEFREEENEKKNERIDRLAERRRQ